jgi:hypothetical protein
VYLFGALLLFTPLMDMEKAATRGANYTALIDITGMIADKEPASADNIVGSLRAAFEDKRSRASSCASTARVAVLCSQVTSMTRSVACAVCTLIPSCTR